MGLDNTGLIGTQIKFSVMRGIIMLRIFIVGFMRDKKSWALIILGALPAIILFGLMPVLPPYDALFLNIVQTLYIRLLLPLVGLILGTAVISEEIESHKIVQFVTRPLRRFEVVFWRYLSALLAGTIIAVIDITFLYCLFITTGGIEINLLFDAWGLSVLCNIVYCAIFVLLAIAIKKPLMWGVLVCLYEQILGTILIFIGGPQFSLSGHIIHVGALTNPRLPTIADWTPMTSATLLVVITIICLIFAMMIFRLKDLS